MSLCLYFGPLLDGSQTGKESNSLCSRDLIISVFQLILDLEHKTKTVRETEDDVYFIIYQQKNPKPQTGVR